MKKKRKEKKTNKSANAKEKSPIIEESIEDEWAKSEEKATRRRIKKNNREKKIENICIAFATRESRNSIYLSPFESNANLIECILHAQ